MTPDSGNIFFVDSWGQQNEVFWETIVSPFGTLLDTTTIIRQPYVWDSEDEGYIENFKVFRRGICTTERSVIQVVDDGYIILAEGSTQEICVFQTTFPGQPQPSDPFKYHLDHDICDSDELLVTCGSRWTNPEEENDDEVVWSDVSMDGEISFGTSEQPFQWIDVWSNDEDLTAVCE